MPIFKYTGKSSIGRQLSGKIDAANKQTAREQLISQKLQVITLQEQKKSGSSFLDTSNFTILPERKVTPEDLVLFCQQMATLIKAGLSLLQALDTIRLATEIPPLARVLATLIEDLDSGQSITTAFAKHKLFPPIFVQLLEAGEKSGQLESIFRKLTSYLELESKTKKQLKSAMIYPAMVGITMLIVIIVIGIGVVPKFTAMFSNSNMALPWQTKVLIGFSNLLIYRWWALIIGVVSIVGGFNLALRNQEFLLHWSHFKLKMPIFGQIMTKIATTRFTSIFSLLNSAGISFLESLSIASKSTLNPYIIKAMSECAQQVEKGNTLSSSMMKYKIFPSLAVQMLSIGEKTGSVDTMLFEVARYCEGQVDNALANINKLIEPIVMLILGAVVAMIVSGIFLPLIQLNNAILK